MHEKLIDVLLQFARLNKLRFDYNFDNKRKVYFFKFQNQDKTWGYVREISEEQLDTSLIPTEYFAYGIIDTLKRKNSSLI